MSENIISVRTYAEPPIRKKEILRYMGAKEVSDELLTLLDSCIAEAHNCFSYRVCFREFAVHPDENGTDLSFARVESVALRKNLTGCDRSVLFASTVGLEIDRLIAKYSRLYPVKALCMQAFGAERIEALCDAFNDEMNVHFQAEGCFLRPRFSPGYGDLPLALQKDIFRVLDCPRKIGLSLNESLLMSPSKSVTAIIGIGKDTK